MIRRAASAVVVLVFAAILACSQGKPPPEAAQGPGPAPSPTQASQPEAGPLVIFLGDSLTAGYELGEDRAFPALVAQALRAEGVPLRVVNAGVSGDTTAGGLRRLDWLLAQKPDVLVVELGANDGLRGHPLDEIQRNLRAIVERARGAGVRVLLLGMRIPPSYGPEYTRGFARTYPKLAKELAVPLVPFLLQGVAGRPELNLPDGIHPNAEGARIVAATVVPYLRRLLAQG